MNKKQRRTLYRIIAAAVLFIAAALVCRFAHLDNIYLRAVLYMIPYTVIGYDILIKAFRGILHGQVFDENFLMAVASVGAICLGEFAESCAVILFYQIGELFQGIAVGRSRRSIASLMDIRPDHANLVLPDGGAEEVDPEDVEVGSEIVVAPGERIPIDGVIVEGDTMLDTSALTGESVPRRAAAGDAVISGCICMSGVIKVKTTKDFGMSTVSRILELVENSAMKKSRSENFITKFARIYTPAVCAGALLLAIVPPLVINLTGGAAVFSEWIVRALTFLVISCPCALVISVPMSFFGGIGCASSNGILVKGSSYLEALADVKYIVFDKTGTLTKGSFDVTGVYPTDGTDRDMLLRYAACAESASSHPISLSLRRALGDADTAAYAVSDIHETAGHGVSASVDGHRVCVGNRKLMQSEGIDAAKLEKRSGTVVYVSIDGAYAGCITVADCVKPTSREAIQSLKKSGIKRTVMLTGDSAEAARDAAEQVGIDEVRSGLLPADKVDAVEELLGAASGKEKLAFVGDGINDAPVLSRADIGIAMGALGSDAAIEAADIVLMDDDPADIALAMRIARRTLGIARQNIVFALAVKVLCLILGAVGIAGMWLAIFADVGVMVLAVLNAVRALKLPSRVQ